MTTLLLGLLGGGTLVQLLQLLLHLRQDSRNANATALGAEVQALESAIEALRNNLTAETRRYEDERRRLEERISKLEARIQLLLQENENLHLQLAQH